MEYKKPKIKLIELQFEDVITQSKGCVENCTDSLNQPEAKNGPFEIGPEVQDCNPNYLSQQ